MENLIVGIKSRCGKESIAAGRLFISPNARTVLMSQQFCHQVLLDSFADATGNIPIMDGTAIGSISWEALEKGCFNPGAGKRQEFMTLSLKKSVRQHLHILAVGFFLVYLILSLFVLLISGLIPGLETAVGSPLRVFFVLIIVLASGMSGFFLIQFRILRAVKDIEISEKQVKDQILKIGKDAIELSDVTRKFENTNDDIGISSTRLNPSLNEYQEQEQAWRIMFENSPLGILRFDAGGSIIDFNDKFVAQMGSTRENLIGFNTATKSTPEMQAALKKALKGEESIFEGEYTSVTGDKTSYFRAVFNPVNPGISPTQVIGTVEDITKRVQAETQLQESHLKLERLVKERTSTLIQKIEELKQIEEALRKSEEKYRSILDSMDDVYFESDLKGRLVFFNRALPEFLGYPESELNQISYKAVTDHDNQKKLKDIFRTVYETGNASPLLHCSLFRKDKEKVEVSFKVSLIRDKADNPVGFKGLARDVTQQRIMEYRLQHSQKMEAIGSLAGGVAHDFNNILGAIVGYTHLVQKHKSDKARVSAYTEQILKAGDRAAGLVNQILLFSRETKSQKVPSELGLVAKEVLKLLRASIPSTIDIHQHISPDLFTVLADQTQIHQVLMNLCANASHAMRETGGRLDVCLENLSVTTENRHQYYDLNAGDYIHLAVKDNGCGIDQETLKKIFDPYFTTKDVGEGTGLGLATVHGIIKEHDGVILVQSQVQKGTRCDIYLPAIEKVVEDSRHDAGIPTGTERILFVDDEAYLTDVGKEMLEDFGYHVDTFTSSVAALDAFKEHPGGYDIVITDYTMPAMTGEQMAVQIHDMNPLVPIIMCTGITLDSKVTSNKIINAVLMKPLDMDKLLHTIRSALDQRKRHLGKL